MWLLGCAAPYAYNVRPRSGEVVIQRGYKQKGQLLMSAPLPMPCRISIATTSAWFCSKASVGSLPYFSCFATLGNAVFCGLSLRFVLLLSISVNNKQKNVTQLSQAHYNSPLKGQILSQSALNCFSSLIMYD